jgi:hypothetical protein
LDFSSQIVWTSEILGGMKRTFLEEVEEGVKDALLS